MIGAGVFTTSGFALADLGTPQRVLAAWLLGGLIALAGAACYAALIRQVTESGGEYVFLARIVHPLAGFVAGWVSLLAGFTAAIAFAALAFATYAQPLLPMGLPASAVAIGVILAAALLHGLRVRTGAVSQNLLVAVKLSLILGFLIYCVVVDAPGQASPALSAVPEFSVAAFAGSIVWISLSYSGFNAAVYVAGEARNPRRDVPRALLWGTAGVVLIYLALNTVFLWLPPYDAVAGRADIAAAAADAIGGTTAATLIRAVIALALLTSVFSMIMAGPRVYARMADDGLLPSNLRLTADAPRASIALQALLAALVVLFADLRELLGYLGFTLSLSAAGTVACLFILRRRLGAAGLPMPGYPLLPLVFIGATLLFAGLAAARQPGELLAAGVTLISGVAVYGALRHFAAAPD
jgi:amino acid transporter